MRKVTILIVGVVTLFYAGNAILANEQEPSQTMTLRVTSSAPDIKVSFEGSIVAVGDENTFVSVSQETPYFFTAEAKSLSAQFHKTKGDASLHVEIERFNSTDQSGMTSGSGTGNIILLVQGFRRVSKDYVLSM